jgi:hypothetical protein
MHLFSIVAFLPALLGQVPTPLTGNPGWAQVLSMMVYMLIPGGIGALIGRTKGRGGAGFLLGFLLGPIGWIITFFLRQKHTEY